MKRLILVMTACLAVAVGRAADYGFLTFLSADGTKVSMNVTALTMTFVDGKLVASNGTEIHEMSVADLNSMYFTDQNLTGIAETTAAGEDNVKQVYTLAGIASAPIPTCLLSADKPRRAFMWSRLQVEPLR